MVLIQEMIVIDDLLSALTGIDGRYISIKKSGGGEDAFSFHVDGSMDLALQARMFTYVESAKRIFPLCKSYLLINQFVESRSQFKSGLVNHAFAAALRALLLVSLIFNANLASKVSLFFFFFFLFRFVHFIDTIM
ncbi:putative gamma-tubulin complex component protein [Helianthus annuus]|nr:putative gamma-tubulin complex component protein [Helianthus annuus]